MRKGFIPLVLVVIVLVVATIGAFAYIKLKPKFTSQPVVTQTPPTTAPSPTDETANPSSKALATEDWKTYTNTKDKFTLKYPSDYQLIKTTSDTSMKFYLPNAKENIYGVMIGGGFQVMVNDSNTTSLETAADHFFIQGKLNLCQKTPNIKLDNADAIRCDYKPKGEGESPEDFVTVFAINNNKSYLVHAWASGKDAEDLIKNFNQILSNFQFTDS